MGPRRDRQLQHISDEDWRWMSRRLARLKRRCKSNPSYVRDGICVCDEWKGSVNRFIEDMGIPDDRSMTIDRINPSGSYESANCRWATHRQQAWNKRNVILATSNDGETKPVAEWSLLCGIPCDVLKLRIKQGLSITEAMNKPFVGRGRTKKCPHPLYSTWSLIKQRCLNPNANSYGNYGGSGVKICDRWACSFSNFVKDVGEKPSKKHTLDRINPSLGYSKENCRWATPKEQGENKKNTRWLVIGGERLTTEGWSKKPGAAKLATIRNRMSQGWTDAKKIVFGKATDDNKRHEVFGEKLMASEIAEKYGILSSVISRRLRAGLTGERLVMKWPKPEKIEIDGISKLISEWSQVSGTLIQTIRWRLRHGKSPRESVYGKSQEEAPT